MSRLNTAFLVGLIEVMWEIDQFYSIFFHWQNCEPGLASEKNLCYINSLPDFTVAIAVLCFGFLAVSLALLLAKSLRYTSLHCRALKHSAITFTAGV
ncbi:hypothetical protein V6N13_124237 [Hibiscus sabdariffa]|uniref:CASP-like protein n=1 Tax=Hibiscus sabdariffa TaxID=183260 RepID=A0ABR2S0R3_9ROSI